MTDNLEAIWRDIETLEKVLTAANASERDELSKALADWLLLYESGGIDSPNAGLLKRTRELLKDD